jgi:hypothetical protein
MTSILCSSVVVPFEIPVPTHFLFFRSTPESLSLILTALLTGCADTSEYANFDQRSHYPFPDEGDLKPNTGYFYMVAVIKHFLTVTSL